MKLEKISDFDIQVDIINYPYKKKAKTAAGHINGKPYSYDIEKIKKGEVIWVEFYD